MAGTRIINRSITTDWSSVKAEIQTAQNDTVIIVSPAQGFTDGGQILKSGDSDSVTATAANLSLLNLTNATSTSLTVGGDYSTASDSSKTYNLYLQGTYNGGSSTVSLVHAAGDLHLHLTANTGAAKTYTADTDIRAENTVYSENEVLDSDGLPVYAKTVVGNATTLPELELTANTCLTGDLTLAADTTLEGHHLAEDTELVVETKLETGSILKAGCIFLSDPGLAGASFADLTDGRKILLADYTLTGDKSFESGTVLKTGSTILSDDSILKDTVLTDKLAITSDYTVYKGSVINGEEVTEEYRTLTTGFVVEADSVLRTEASIGVTLSEDTTLLAGTTLVAGQMLPSGEKLAETTVLKTDTVFKAGSLLLDGTVLADGTVLKKGTILEKGTILPDGSSIAAGTVTTKKMTIGEGGQTLANNWVLASDTTFADGLMLSAPVTTGGDIVLAGDLVLVSETVLGGDTTLAGTLTLTVATRLGDNTVLGSGDVTLVGGTLLGDTTVLKGTTTLTDSMTLAADVTLGGTTTLGGDLTLVKDTTLGGDVTLAGDLTIVKDTLVKAGSVIDGTVLTADKVYASGSTIKSGSTIASGTVLARNSKLAAETVMQGGTVLVSGTVLADGTQFGDGTVLGAGNVLSGDVVLHSGTVIGGNTVLDSGTVLSADTVLGAGTVLGTGTELSKGTVLGGGTVLAKDTVLAEGQVLSAGTELERGNILPAGLEISAGTVTAEGMLLSGDLTLSRDLPLIADTRLGGDMTVTNEAGLILANVLAVGEGGLVLGEGGLELSSDMTLCGTVELKEQTVLLGGAVVGTDGLKLIGNTTLSGEAVLKGDTTLSAATTLGVGSVLGQTGVTTTADMTLAQISDLVDGDGRLKSTLTFEKGTVLAKGTRVMPGQTINGVTYQDGGKLKDNVTLDSATEIYSGTLFAEGSSVILYAVTLQGESELKAGTVLKAGTQVKKGQTINGKKYQLGGKLTADVTLEEDTVFYAGTVLMSSSVIKAGSVLGTMTEFTADTTFAANTELDSGTVLASGTVLHAGTVLNSGTTLGQGTILAQGTELTDGTVLGAGTTLAEGTELGEGTMITRGSTLGKGSVIGAGTILASGTIIPAGSAVPGNTVLASGTVLDGTTVLLQDATLTGTVTLTASATGASVSLKGTTTIGEKTTLAEYQDLDNTTTTVGSDLKLGDAMTLRGTATLGGTTTLGGKGLTVGENGWCLKPVGTTVPYITAGEESRIGEEMTLNAKIVVGTDMKLSSDITLNSLMTISKNQSVTLGADLTGEHIGTYTSSVYTYRRIGELTVGNDMSVKYISANNGSSSTLKAGSLIIGRVYYYDETTKTTKYTIYTEDNPLVLTADRTFEYGIVLEEGSIVKSGSVLQDLTYNTNQVFTAGSTLSGTGFYAGTELKSGTILGAGCTIPSKTVLGEGLELTEGTKIYASEQVYENGELTTKYNTLSKGTVLTAGSVIPASYQLDSGIVLDAGTTFGSGTTIINGDFAAGTIIGEGTQITVDDNNSSVIWNAENTLSADTQLSAGTILYAGLKFDGLSGEILSGTRKGTNTYILTSAGAEGDVTLAYAARITRTTTLKSGTVVAAGTVLDDGSSLSEDEILESDIDVGEGTILAAGTVLASGTITGEDMVLVGATVISENTEVTSGTVVENGSEPRDANLNLYLKASKNTMSAQAQRYIGTESDDITHYSALDQTDVAAIRSEKDLYADGSLAGTLTVLNTDFKNKGYIAGKLSNSTVTYYGIDTVSNAKITAVGLEGVNITVEQNQYLKSEQTVGSTSETAAELLWFGHTGATGVQNGFLSNTDVHAAAFQTGDGSTGKVTLDNGVWAGTLVSQTQNITVKSTYRNVNPTSSTSVENWETYYAKLTDDIVASYGIYAGSASIVLMDDAQDGTAGETEITSITQGITLVSEGYGIVDTNAKTKKSEISNTTVTAVGLNVQELTIGEMTDQYDMDVKLQDISLTVRALGEGTSDNTFLNNKIMAAGINASTLTVDSFRGNINVSVDNITTNVSGIKDYTSNYKGNSVAGVGIITSGAISSDSVLGGKITGEMSGISVYTSKAQGYVSLEGIEAASITVDGRIETSIDLTNAEDGAIAVLGMFVTGSVQSTAVSSDITINNGMANAIGLSVKDGFTVTDVDGTKQSGLDLFDFNGSITVNGRQDAGGDRYGIMSQKAMNLRISGTIDVGVKGVAIQTQTALVNQYEKVILTNTFSDRIEFADTAKVTGDIGLTYGTDNIVMYSGAEVTGTLTNNNGNLLNLEFFLTEHQHADGIYQSTASSEKEDVTLSSVTTLSVNINNMLDGTEYVLMEYGFDVSSYFTYGSSSRTIDVTYQGQTVKVTVPTGKGVQNGVKATFGDDAEATVYLSGDGKSLRIVSGMVKDSMEYSDARLYTGNGNRTLCYSSELGLSYEDYVKYHQTSIIYNQDEETLRLCWAAKNLDDLFGNGNGTLQDYYYEVEYRFYHMAADGVTKEYAGESITEKVNKTVSGVLQTAEYLTLTGIENSLGVEWRVRAVSSDGHKTTAWSSENEYTGKAESGWEQVEINVDADPLAADVSKVKTNVSNGTSSDGQTLDASLVRLSWSGAEAGTYAIDHYAVDYFYSSKALSSDDQASYWKYQDASKLSDRSAVLSEVWNKNTSSQELYLTNMDSAKYVYWRVSAVDSAANASRSDYVYGNYFANYPNDKTAPYFVSPGMTEVHGKDSTYNQTWVSFVHVADEAEQQEALNKLLTNPNFTFAYYLDYCNGTPVLDSDWTAMKSGSTYVSLTQEDLKIWNKEKTEYTYRYDDDGNPLFEKTVSVTSTDTLVRTHTMMGVMYSYNPGETFSADFYWTKAEDVQSGVRSYVLQYQTSGSSTWNEITIASSEIDKTTGLYTYHTDGLADGTVYTFRVYAIDSNGNSMVVNNKGTWNNEAGFTFGDNQAPEWVGNTHTVTEYTYVAASTPEESGTYSVAFQFSSAFDTDFSVEGTDYESSNAIERYTVKAYLNGTLSSTWDYKYTRDDKGMWGFHYVTVDKDGNEIIADTAVPSVIPGEEEGEDEEVYTVSLDGFVKGKYTFSVTACDFAGNETTMTTDTQKAYGDFYAPRFKVKTLKDEKGNDAAITATVDEESFIEDKKTGKWTYSVNLNWSPAEDTYQAASTDPVQDNQVIRYYVQYREAGASTWNDWSVRSHEQGTDYYTETVSGLEAAVYEFRVVSEDGLGNTDLARSSAQSVSEYDSETGTMVTNTTSLTISVPGIKKPEWPEGTKITVKTENQGNVYTANLTFPEADAPFVSSYEVTVTPPSSEATTYLYVLNRTTGKYVCSVNGDIAVLEDDTVTVHITDCIAGEYSVTVRAEEGVSGLWSDTISTVFGDTVAPRFKVKTLKDEKGNDTAITVVTENYKEIGTSGVYTYDAVVTWSPAEDAYQKESDSTLYDNGVNSYCVQYRVHGTTEWTDWITVGSDIETTTITDLDQATYDYRVVSSDKLGNTGDGTQVEEYDAEKQATVLNPTSVACTVTGLRDPEWPSEIVSVYEISGSTTAEIYSYTAAVSFQAAVGAGINLQYKIVLTDPDNGNTTYKYSWIGEDQYEGYRWSGGDWIYQETITVTDSVVALNLAGLTKAGDYTVSITALGSCGKWTETAISTTFGDSTAPRFKETLPESTDKIAVVTQGYTGGETKTSTDVTYNAVVTWAAASDKYQDASETKPQDNGIKCYHVQYRVKGAETWENGPDIEAGVHTATLTGLTAAEYEYRVVSEDKLGNTDVLVTTEVLVKDTEGEFPTSVSKELQGIATPEWTDKTITVTTGESARSTSAAYCYQANLKFTAMSENITEQMSVADSELANRIYVVTLKHGTETVGTYSYQWDTAKQAYYCSTNSDTAVVDESTITVHLDCSQAGDYTAAIDARNSCCMWTADTISTTFGDSYAPTVTKEAKLNIVETLTGYFLGWNADGFTDEYTDAAGIKYDNGVKTYTIEYRLKDSQDAWKTLATTSVPFYQTTLQEAKYEFRVYASDNLDNVTADDEHSVYGYCTDESAVVLQSVTARQESAGIVFEGMYAYDSMGVVGFVINVDGYEKTVLADEVKDGKYIWTGKSAAGKSFSVYAVNIYGSKSNTVTGVVTYDLPEEKPYGVFDSTAYSSTQSSTYYWSIATLDDKDSGISNNPQEDAHNEEITRTVKFQWDGSFEAPSGGTIYYALELSDNALFQAADEDSVHIVSLSEKASPFEESEFVAGKTGQVYVFTGITSKTFTIGDYAGNASCSLDGMSNVYWRVVVYDSYGNRMSETSATNHFYVDNTYFVSAIPSAVEFDTPTVTTDETTGLKKVTINYTRSKGEDYESAYGYVSDDLVISSSAKTIEYLKEAYGDSVVSSTATSLRIKLPHNSYSGSAYSGELYFTVLPGDSYVMSVISTEGAGVEVESQAKAVTINPDESEETLGGLEEIEIIRTTDKRYALLESWTDASYNISTDASTTLVGTHLVMDETVLGLCAANKGEHPYLKIEVGDSRFDGDYVFSTDGNQDFTVTVYAAVKGTDQYILTRMEKNSNDAYRFIYSENVSYYACIELKDKTVSSGWTELTMAGKNCVLEKLEVTEPGYVSADWSEFVAGGTSKIVFNERPAFRTSETEITEIGLENQVSCRVNGTLIGTVDAGTVSSVEKWIADSDLVTDLFYARVSGTWDNNEYVALNMVSGETAAMTGKNKITDIFTGSNDTSILVLTDDANGDALFLDDIYSDLPEDVKQQARFTLIDTVIAGKGDDLVDLTSDRYDGEGMTVLGGAGKDIIWGSTGNDVLSGGSDRDILAGDGGDDIFCFGENFGNDTVTQVSTGSVTLWFKSGSEANWHGEGYWYYSDGVNTVTVSGSENITLKFGDDGSETYKKLSVLGAFD